MIGTVTSCFRNWRGICLIGALSVTAACSAIHAGAPTAVDTSNAKQMAALVLQQTQPSYPSILPAANCIRDNATPAEIFALSAEYGATIDQATIAKVTEIAHRPGTTQCVKAQGLPPLA